MQPVERFVNHTLTEGLTAEKAAPNGASIRPSEDQIYLAGRINDRWEYAGEITPGAIVRWNRRHGLGEVASAMRLVHGFPPEIPTSSAYAYVDAVLRGEK